MRAACLLCLGLLALPAAGAQDFAYVRDAAAALAGGAVVVDARPQADCMERSLAGARCLPAMDLLGPHHSLPSWRDLIWLLSAAGLKGDETVLVVGQDATDRDFVAGLLHLAGQKRVLILSEPVPRAVNAGLAAAPGSPRAFARSVVFEAPMRDDLLVLGQDLHASAVPPPLLDGRSEEEYWGGRARAVRGGHLPGAQNLPAAHLRAAPGATPPLLPAGTPVAYGHDPLDGIAYFALLRAGHGVEARLYAEGWAEWAADGSLPADAVTYPEPIRIQVPPPPPQPLPIPTIVTLVLGLVATAFAAGLFLGRRRAARSAA